MASLSDLCLSCGLCCDGSLFRYVRLAPSEAERLVRAGCEVAARRDGSPALRLGCAGLRGLRCGLYADRPEGCRAFVCSAGAAFLSGVLSFAGALELIREGRSLVAQVERALPEGAPLEPRSVLQRAAAVGLRGGPEPLRRAQAFLRAHFLGG
jgi:hypothetical protein